MCAAPGFAAPDHSVIGPARLPMPEAPDLDSLHAQLEQWAAAHYHEGVQVSRPAVMPGRATRTFGFRVLQRGQVLDDLVLRLPRPAARRPRNADVVRQVPLVRALGAAGVPVPPVVWWDTDERWFRAPYLMMARSAGATCDRHDRDRSTTGLALGDALGQAIDALAHLHAFDWRARLPSWEPPRALADEVRAWDRFLARSAERSWFVLGERVRDRLLDTAPDTGPVGVVHGDFQMGSVLFRAGSLVALVDWENAGIGHQLLDLGSLLTIDDPTGAGASAELPTVSSLVDRYAAASGRAVTLGDVGWSRAFAGYRLALSASSDVRRSRSLAGPEPGWDRTASKIEFLLDRAEALLHT